MELQNLNNKGEIELFSDVCHIVEGSRQRLATTVNAEICLMHWQIGKRIKDDVLYNQRADYGKQVVKNLAEQLTQRFGKGWSIFKLQHCVRSAYTIDMDSPSLINEYRRPTKTPVLHGNGTH